MVYTMDERKVRDTFEEDCWQGAQHQRLQREAQEECARQDVPK